MNLRKIALTFVALIAASFTIHSPAYSNTCGESKGCGGNIGNLCNGTYEVQGGWGSWGNGNSRKWTAKMILTQDASMGTQVHVTLLSDDQPAEQLIGTCKLISGSSLSGGQGDMVGYLTFSRKIPSVPSKQQSFKGLISNTWTTPHWIITGSYFDPTYPNMYPWSAATRY